MELSQWIRPDLLVNVSRDEDTEHWYAARVLEIGKHSFRIALPQRKTGPLAVPVGHKVRLSTPSDQGLFLFTCLLLAVSEPPDTSWELDLPREIVHVERRIYPRVPVHMQVYYSEIREKTGPLVFNKSFAFDISGGGLRLETHRRAQTETLLRLKFTLPLPDREQEFVLTGRIVRMAPGEGVEKGQAGVEFIDISTRDQESILQFALGSDSPAPGEAAG